MGLYSLELWLHFVMFEQAKRESDVLPIPGLLGFVCVGLVWGLFCFLLFLVVQTELICSQLWKVQGTMKTSASQNCHQAIFVAWQCPLCV